MSRFNSVVKALGNIISFPGQRSDGELKRPHIKGTDRDVDVRCGH